MPSQALIDRQKRALVVVLLVLTVCICATENDIKFPRYRNPIPTPFGHFDLDTLAPEFVIAYMRFNKDEIRLLCDKLQLWKVRWRHRYQPSSETALCLVLARLAWPERLITLQRMFHKSPSWISTIYNDVCCFLWQEYRHLVEWHPMLNNYQRLKDYAKAIGERAGVPKMKIWGFIDGTFRGIARPKEEQRMFYSGYKKKHGIKWQGIMTPDGILTLQGPYEGRINDWAIYHDTKVESRLREVLPLSLALFVSKIANSLIALPK